MKLGPSAIAAGYEIISHDSIGSTNSEALRLAITRESDHPLWVVAKRQTSGKGRQDRVWSSPPGNFYGSLLLTNPCEARYAAQLGFVAGVALTSALAELAPALTGLTLKWPNDALLKGAKIAGILLEASTLSQRGGRLVVAIGIGINLAFHPEDTPYPATNLASAGAPISVDDCLSCLSDAFAEKLQLFDRGDNFASIRQAWLAGAHGIGTPVKVRSLNDTIHGEFGGIDENGALILNQDGKMQLINAGDVYFTG